MILNHYIEAHYLIAMAQRRCTIAPADAPIIIPRSFFPAAMTTSRI